ncbi:flippase [Rubrolithibacter danxiaensis]|uniref:flippase n=1 Tax=Rubrolithibacter danxiaensis TaxID=3390805 RepID=UPI003BF8404D
MKIPALPGFDPAAFEKYLKNTGWLMFGKILSMIIGFIIARYLGPYAFGELSFADAFTSLFAAVATLGLDSFIIREIINSPQSRDEILGTSLWLRLSVSILLIPVAVVIYIFFKEDSTQTSLMVSLIAFCATATVFKSFNIIDSYFQSQVQSKYVVQVQNVCLIISAVVKVVFVWLKLPVIYFALALVMDGVLLAAGLMLIYKKKGFSLLSWKFNKTRAFSLLEKSWPLILSAVMISIYMKIDQVMLKRLGSEEVGVYSAAAKISESWYFIPVAIVSSVFPAILNARKTDINRYNKRLQNLYDLLVAISLPVAIVISFLANDIIQIIYGDRYAGAGTMLSIHIWSGIFVFLGSASSQYLLAEGYTVISFIRTGVGAIINVVLNIWLIPRYGGVGASVATLIAYIIAVFFIFFLRRTRKQAIMMFQSLFLISLVKKL